MDRLHFIKHQGNPFVKRAAFVGAESLPKVFYEALKTFSRREFPRFKTREEAMDWLVREEVFNRDLLRIRLN